jgi:hypothetical protein
VLVNNYAILLMMLLKVRMPVAMNGIVSMLKDAWSRYTEAHMTKNSVLMTIGS